MKKMKKALSLSLALLMSALLFVGCAKADEKAEVVTTTEVSSDVPETKTSETTTEAPETEATTTEAPATETPEETEIPEETTAPVTEAPTTEATTIATTATTTVATTAKAEVPTESRITLSGNASDKFIADKYCYAESDKVILYFEKGVEIRGDMLKTAEEVIADLENYTGLKFSKNYQGNEYYAHTIELLEPEMNRFKSVNPDLKKVNIYVADLGKRIQYAEQTGIVVESSDFYREETFCQVLYHELTHLLHLRNGKSLESTLNEGFALHTAYETLKKRKSAPWSIIQYFGNGYQLDPTLFDQKDAGFRYVFDKKDDNYHYGFRFVTFIHQTYGSDVMNKIISDATASGFDVSYSGGPDNRFSEAKNEELKKIIKRNTSEDVFEKFSVWVKNDWAKEEKEYYDYMQSVGLL
ncbi:MAG: hypothetical protein IKK32_07310 [Oscillospiraceae bacterium]|nr:hypothetical protein [Oscillospiraceae bacterium]